jgi:hypothetical protein
LYYYFLTSFAKKFHDYCSAQPRMRRGVWAVIFHRSFHWSIVVSFQVFQGLESSI